MSRRGQQCLAEASSVQAVVADETVNVSKVKEFAAAAGLEIPVLVYLTKLTAKDFPEAAGFIHHGKIDEDLRACLHDLTGDDFSFEYCPVKADVLQALSPLNCDVFIRLGKTKFVRLFAAGSEFEKADEQKYFEEKQVERLFIRHEAYKEVLTKLTANLDALVTGEAADDELVAEPLVASQELLRSVINRSGFTKEALELARKNVEVAQKTLKMDASFGKLLDYLEKNRDKYIAAHSFALAEVVCAIAGDMGWRTRS